MRVLFVASMLIALGLLAGCGRDAPAGGAVVFVADVARFPATGEFVPFDTPPSIVDYRPPEYPEEGRSRRLEGTVRVKVVVGVDGLVESAQVLESAADPLLERAAVEAARRYRFNPATRAGEPVPCTIAIPFRYTLGE